MMPDERDTPLLCRPESYRLVGRLKNNRLWSAIVEQWPEVKTQSAAAAKLEMSGSEFGRILNMRFWPWSRTRHRWYERATRIAAMLGLPPEYLFDSDLYGIEPQKVEVEFTPSTMAQLQAAAGNGETKLLASAFKGEQKAAIGRALHTLTAREEHVIRERYGLDGEERTYEAIGVELGVTRERVRQIQYKALRKLRHPGGSRSLRPFVENPEDLEASYEKEL